MYTIRITSGQSRAQRDYGQYDTFIQAMEALGWAEGTLKRISALEFASAEIVMVARSPDKDAAEVLL